MIIERIRRAGPGGFSLLEVVVVVAVIGILMALSIPTFLTYWRTSTIRAGAQEMVTLLNQARSLAIGHNASVCVQSAANNPSFTTRIRYQIGTTNCSLSANCPTAGVPCANTCTATAGVTPCIWTGPGTDSVGWLTLSNRIESRSPGGFLGQPYVVFTYLGSASPAGTFRVRIVDNPTSISDVQVTTSGRVRYTF